MKNIDYDFEQPIRFEITIEDVVMPICYDENAFSDRVKEKIVAFIASMKNNLGHGAKYEAEIIDNFNAEFEICSYENEPAYCSVVVIASFDYLGYARYPEIDTGYYIEEIEAIYEEDFETIGNKMADFTVDSLREIGADMSVSAMFMEDTGCMSFQDILDHKEHDALCACENEQAYAWKVDMEL